MSEDNKKLIELDKRIEKLEKTIQEFLDSWGPDVQRKRDERDERWDEMVRVLTIQKKHNRNK
tara:strand:- start:181 stop:366 length:186 start_codon:yes stop_codon:yes gene_type:complete